MPAAEHLGGIDVHPAGHSFAVDVRGKPFTFALWEGAVRQHGDADGGRYRHVQWLADGMTTVAIGDASGEERVVAFGEDPSGRCRGTSAASSRCAQRRAGRASRLPTIATRC